MVDHDSALKAVQYLFGAEPSDIEVLSFVLDIEFCLGFSRTYLLDFKTFSIRACSSSLSV
ncbi:hypothetical protein [Phormidesmis priestleyi]|uniref:hypothetical protein n=1 Tax=Phormidesmis priestleyi TaxID=268141 RepID=UPI0012E865AB